MSTTTQAEKANGCANCGGSLVDGYEERDHGVDSETGYHDCELVCSSCIEAEKEDDDRYAAADDSLTGLFEDGE